MQVEGIQVHANEGGVTQTRGGVYWIILPAGCNHSPVIFYCSLTCILISMQLNYKSESIETLRMECKKIQYYPSGLPISYFLF